ncbi:hypothetical protein PTI98_005600 [Pleurotus ostreatus]|nr:hypothetical protein PTI98_005600 [Pleurotus ostreatus]
MELSLSTIPDLTAYVTKQGAYPAAHGGFADIWMCTLNNEAYPSIAQNVAVKVLRSLGSGFNNEGKPKKRLRRELAVWLELQHPQVLPLYGIVLDFGPYPSMVCPWMDKGNLSNYLSGDGESLDVEGRYKILRQVCSGLAYLHSRSVVHGDLTGCNVLISGDGDACLSDFGLSTIISDLQGVSTFTSSISGNVRFAAPELYQVGDDDVRTLPTTHSDIYSLGSIILQTLTGEVPYHYMKTDGQVLIELSRGVHPRRPQDPIVTEARWRLLCACWQRGPSHRPTLEAVVEYLQDPDGTFRPLPHPLPHLTDIHPDNMVNISHGLKMEFWTAPGEGGRAVALKMFRLPLLVSDKDAVLQEMRDIGEVGHYNLLSYAGTTMYDGLPSIVMPWVPGHNLRAHLQTSVSVSQKLTLLRQIASGLLHLHSIDIVHGGLTGWNIFVTEDGEAILTNFGLMPILYRRVGSSEILETYDEDCRWADPVLWFGFTDGQARPPETSATDVYAFGRVVYQVRVLYPPIISFHK